MATSLLVQRAIGERESKLASRERGDMLRAIRITLVTPLFKKVLSSK